MSSNGEHNEEDMAGVIVNDDEGLFLPCPPPAGPNSWTVFWGGILTGLAGGAIAIVAPWLGGLLISGGYALTALTLSAPGNRFVRAIRFGYIVSAILGIAIAVAYVLDTPAMRRIFDFHGKQYLFFGCVLALPLVIGMLRYGYALARQEKRRA